MYTVPASTTQSLENELETIFFKETLNKYVLKKVFPKNHLEIKSDSLKTFFF